MKQLTNPKPKLTKNAGRKPEVDRSLIKDRKITFLVTEETYNILKYISKMEKTTLSDIITKSIETKMEYYINKNQNRIEFKAAEEVKK